MINHKQFENNIPKFFKNELTGNELRRFAYHFVECETCREQAMEEYAFYTTYNDLDKELNFDYRKDLKKKIDNTISQIESNDKILQIKYFIVSVLICIFGVIAVGLLLRIIYK